MDVHGIMLTPLQYKWNETWGFEPQRGKSSHPARCGFGKEFIAVHIDSSEEMGISKEKKRK